MHLQTSLCLLVLHYWLKSLVWSLALSEHNHQPPHCSAQISRNQSMDQSTSKRQNVCTVMASESLRGCQQGNHSSHHLLWILGRGCATLLGCSTACLHSCNVVAVTRRTGYTGWQPCCSSSEGLTCFFCLFLALFWCGMTWSALISAHGIASATRGVP